MNEAEAYAQRVTAVYLIQQGWTPTKVGQVLGRSRAWGYKWWQRFQHNQAWEDLHTQSRAPRSGPTWLSPAVQQLICRVRKELEAEASLLDQLGYVGAAAIRSRLQAEGLSHLPSRATIERMLGQAGLTQPHASEEEPIHYPHLQPGQPHELIQVDIVPHYLPGGGCVSCFNAIDPVSHYPSGAQSLSKSAAVAMQFLQQVWAEQGRSHYLQLDNESCFSGGTAHPLVLSKVVRLGLSVGTQLVFSPFYHPESNGCVERFHQDYNQHTWQKFELTDLEGVQSTSAHFVESFRHSRHVEALEGHCPIEVQACVPAQGLPQPLALPSQKLPLTAGQVHFMRRVSAKRTVSVLYQDWAVPVAEPDQGVWATLEFSPPQTAVLRIYDTAPDAAVRTCLGEHAFPLQEPVLPLRPEFQPPPQGTASGWTLASYLETTTGSRLACEVLKEVPSC
jgi:transposase